LSQRLPWTKLQDFYLRLGFLKVLTASLSAERRSATNDAIVRRLQRPLFESVGTHAPLAAAAEALRQTSSVRKKSAPTRDDALDVVEVLVGQPQVPSALYAVTRDTAYKIVDWGRDVDFIGRANQISERALLLQSLLPLEEAQRFLAGDAAAWNPFVLTNIERLFFLFHLMERDVVTVRLIEDLAELPTDRPIEARQAETMTCAALFRMLEATENLHDAPTVREHRTALELALAMADEVEAPVPGHWARRATQARAVRKTKVAMRRPGNGGNKPGSARRTTKNADHQTIPRFEQLVDLGFLRKPDADSTDAVVSLAARRRWRYVPTDACRRWSKASKRRNPGGGEQFERSSFAAVAIETFGAAPIASSDNPTVEEVGRRLWSAYSSIGRSVGLSPVDSIALRAMLDAAAQGVPIEMKSVHRLLLIIKERGLLTDCALFAAGSTLDTMFVRLKPNFPERLVTAIPQIREEW
jgi:hypothetical protein